jgi:CBS domain-containing protein/sporulation protein YlmC with PRC-barrel domain
MIYISQLQRQQIWDAYGRTIGRVHDFLVNGNDQNHQRLVALIVGSNPQNQRFIPISQVASLWPSITLKVSKDRLQAYQPSGKELALIDRLLDQQIVDIEGKRVVRVNDLQLARSGDNFLLTGVDVSFEGLLRRLSLEKVGAAFYKLFKKSWEPHVIPWDTVASVEHDDPLRLRVSQARITTMPPADIAAVLDELDYHTSHALLEGLSNETLADTLAESSSEMQVALLSHLDPERAADVLEEMDPDEAADLLADLPDLTSEQLLELMEDEDAEDMRVLLAYPEDSAGGIMTTEFAHVPSNMTVGEAVEFLRQSPDAQEDEVMFYVYILDEEERLNGVVSLRNLVLASPGESLEKWVDHEVIHVSPLTDQQEVAYLVAKYNLLAVPVVDEETQKMLGIVTVDDAIDTVLPTAWKKRLPRFF